MAPLPVSLVSRPMSVAPGKSQPRTASKRRCSGSSNSGQSSTGTIPSANSPAKPQVPFGPRRGPKGTWGFAGELADGIVPVDDCPLFEEPLQRLFEAVRGCDLPGATDIGLDTSDTGRGAIEVRADRPSPALRKRLRALVDSGIVAGSVLGSEIAGNPVLVDSAHPCGFRLRSRPDLFAQANRSMVPALRAA